jgi:hypothetical protein
MVFEGKAWACISDDMDMFVYGCPRVIRYLSLTSKTYALYETSKICDLLEVTINELRQVSVLSGTDYNIHKTYDRCENKDQQQTNIQQENKDIVDHTTQKTFSNSMMLFKKYKSYSKQVTDMEETFYEWLLSQNNINKEEYDILINVCKMFVIKESEPSIQEKKELTINKERLMKVMSKEGFLWC